MKNTWCSKPPHLKHKFPRSTSSPIIDHVIYKSSTNCSSTTKMMDGKPPPGIGKLQEIHYFRQLEINQLPGAGSTISFSKPILGSTITMPTKKKNGSNRIIPSMCSMVDIVEKKNQPHLTSRFSYRSLKADVKTLQF
ncbi:hypothetical protein POM88_045257 [Heracleum sosnowskyi]|uniref:Uncharacterized protein n=1 Tax=Heracleum sosnowskyi TaxID=360622 RepID=A0AAD8M686_9APIA|nr:hypothetical protein POM88_045257 [Heracleum sosnowskyi]